MFPFTQPLLSIHGLWSLVHLGKFFSPSPSQCPLQKWSHRFQVCTSPWGVSARTWQSSLGKLRCWPTFFVSGRLLTLFSLFPALTKKLPVLNSLFYLPPWNSTHVADLPVAEKKKRGCGVWEGRKKWEQRGPEYVKELKGPSLRFIADCTISLPLPTFPSSWGHTKIEWWTLCTPYPASTMMNSRPILLYIPFHFPHCIFF